MLNIDDPGTYDKEIKELRLELIELHKQKRLANKRRRLVSNALPPSTPTNIDFS